MKIKLKKIEQGVCPYCGSTDIDYSACEIEDDDMLYYPARCNDCGRPFDEWYKLNFTGHNVGECLDITTDAGDEGVEIDMPDETDNSGEIQGFTLGDYIMDIEDYLEEIGYSRQSMSVEEYHNYNTSMLWDYPLSEMDYVMKEVGGGFIIVRFPNMYNGYDYRICQLPH